MKFVDLNQLKIRKEYSATELVIDLGKADDLFDLSFSQFKQLIDGLFADVEQKDVESNSVVFAVEVEFNYSTCNGFTVGVFECGLESVLLGCLFDSS